MKHRNRTLFKSYFPPLIQGGIKTQTRRILDPQPPASCPGGIHYIRRDQVVSAPKMEKDLIIWEEDGKNVPVDNPFGGSGDLIGVTQTWATSTEFDKLKPTELPDDCPIYLKDDGVKDWERQADGNLIGRWRSPLFMPNRFIQTWAEIDHMWVEFLHDISEQDIQAEGIMDLDFLKGIQPFERWRELWEKINGKESFEANPLVVAIKFKTLDR